MTKELLLLILLMWGVAGGVAIDVAGCVGTRG
jgi:hypothetical protein